MSDPLSPITELLQQDRRYKLGAYIFVFEALEFAQTTLNLGDEQPSEPLPRRSKKKPKAADSDEDRPEKHLTGQQLCEAIRLFALDQYGYMAKCVLNSWGVYKTGDFGEIVFNLIRVERMRKTERDRREDFDDVFDFDRDLQGQYKISMPE
ncbi:MAG: Minf_1886 family protein [Pirellulales bacterium]